ncbi:MAG: glucuronate isomerase [Synergistaceae bacterium]|nr:glucuronate isomerase [Synergistaceae bacterium]
MKPFMDKDFLLNTKTAQTLFHEVAEKCPIIDYHCHISPKEIWEDLHYDTITQVWLGGDHYKWRLMRCAGVDEKYITGDASDHDKFVKWAEVLGHAIGNPLYHWSHLELRRYFGYEGVLNASTAEEVWNLCNAKLHQADFGVRDLIRRSNVETICTTDDPVDTLEWHEKLANDNSFKTSVRPAWRPDKAMNIEKDTWPDYLRKLSEVSGVNISSFADLKKALLNRMDYFAKHNCSLSDHALNYVMYAPASENELEEIFASRLAGNIPDENAQAKFKTAFMTFAAQEYYSRGWVMQLHYGCHRDNNITMFNKLGPDTGYDCVDNSAPSVQTAQFLGSLEAQGFLPKTILYSLNGNDNAAIDTICGCFQSSYDGMTAPVSKIQHGSAWWFEDHLAGMTSQMQSLASLGYLAGFVGMLTDSRSFLSYPRHEYFRRILCRIIGSWVEEGLFPDDMDTLKEIVKAISYGNAKKYFNF